MFGIKEDEDEDTCRGWSDEEKLDEIIPLLQGEGGDFVYGQLNCQT